MGKMGVKLKVGLIVSAVVVVFIILTLGIITFEVKAFSKVASSFANRASSQSDHKPNRRLLENIEEKIRMLKTVSLKKDHREMQRKIVADMPWAHRQNYPKKRTFVVLTTDRNEPTPQLRMLAESASAYSGAHVIVVSTHANNSYDRAQFESMNSVTFLSIKKQHELPFQTAQWFKTRSRSSFARKNIGYLYAILLEAEVILDADDTTTKVPNSCMDFPTTPTQIADFELYTSTNKRPGLVNHLSYFGLSSFFPRGYMREESSSTYLPWLGPRTSPCAPYEAFSPIMVQVQNSTLDATSKIVDKSANAIRLNPTKEKIAVAVGTFSIVHESLTSYQWNSFPLLMLPYSMPRGIAAIWRGFFSQRVLWDWRWHVGYRTAEVARDDTAFTPQQLSEIRGNNKDISALFETLLDALVHWTNAKTNDVTGSTEKLYDHLRSKNLVEDIDTKLLKHWISDLRQYSYEDNNTASYHPFKWRFFLEKKLARPAEIYHTGSKKQKKFVYLIPTSSEELPESLISEIPDNADVIAWNRNSEVPGMLYFPDSEKNVLVQEMYLRERELGYKYKYIAILESDEIECTLGGKDSDLEECFLEIQRLAQQFEPAVMATPVTKNDNFQLEAITSFTNVLNLIHREAFDQLMPYMSIRERVDWEIPVLQQIEFENTAKALFLGHVTNFGSVQFFRSEPYQTPYPRLLKPLFMDFPTYNYTEPIRLLTKTNHYDDLCDCGTNCAIPICHNKTLSP